MLKLVVRVHGEKPTELKLERVLLTQHLMHQSKEMKRLSKGGNLSEKRNQTACFPRKSPFQEKTTEEI